MKKFFFVLFLLLASFVNSYSVDLQWDANQESVDGYRIFYRAEYDYYDYNQPIWEGAETTCNIDNALFDDGERYFFVARAFLGDNESGDSNEVYFDYDDLTPIVDPTPTSTPVVEPTPNEIELKDSEHSGKCFIEILNE
jgi:hypothetical protein